MLALLNKLSRRQLILVVVVSLFLLLQLFIISTRTEDPAIQVLRMIPVPLHKYLIASSKTYNGTAAELSVADQYTFEQSLLNRNIFGNVSKDTIIIVVQVHNRLNYLRHLIVSLARARYIEATLIIFSHDYFNPEMNDVIQSINFARVIQIYYPLTINNHTCSFLKYSANCCCKNETNQLDGFKNRTYCSKLIYCKEAITLAKHHWWWKANKVFNQLRIYNNHTGLVVFLEEDHYVAEDFLHVLKKIEPISSTTRANIISLGNYLDYTHHYHQDEANLVELEPWISSKHNMGMAFNISVWTKILRCAESFCTFDDYNWDWTLQHVLQRCLRQRIYALFIHATRVFHIGVCGMHHKKENCDCSTSLIKALKVMELNYERLFPPLIHLVPKKEKNKDLQLIYGNGGWKNKEDHKLCLNFTLPS